MLRIGEIKLHQYNINLINFEISIHYSHKNCSSFPFFCSKIALLSFPFFLVQCSSFLLLSTVLFFWGPLSYCPNHFQHPIFVSPNSWSLILPKYSLKDFGLGFHLVSNYKGFVDEFPKDID